MPQGHVFNEEIQKKQPNHQNRADEKYPLYSAEQGRAYMRVQHVEHMVSALVLAESCFELRTHFWKQQGI